MSVGLVQCQDASSYFVQPKVLDNIETLCIGTLDFGIAAS